MTKIEERMKKMIEENCTDEIAGVAVTKLVEGKITLEKQDEFTVVFRDTGFRKRGDIFSKSEFAPYFDNLFLQLFPARFDMILRTTGSVLKNRLNCTNSGIKKVVVKVDHGIRVDDDLPYMCPYVHTQAWGNEDAEPIGDQVLREVAEIITENLELLTDTFLRELKEIAEGLEWEE